VNSPVDSYDLVVIGSGPAGRSGAVTAGRLGKRVAVVDRKERLGGLCLNAGTIPSKILREAVLGIDGFRARNRVGAPPQSLLSIEGLASRVDEVLAREMESAQAELDRHGIALRHGLARFTDPHTSPHRAPGIHRIKLNLRR
jgi:NAD(P) transhydrogenase